LNLKLEVYKNLSLSTKVTKEFIVPINGFLSLDKLNENRVNNYISNINKQALNTINFKNNLASKAKYNNSDELSSDTGNYLKSYIDIDANKYKKYNIGNIEIRLDNARHVIDNDLKASKTIYLVAKCGNYEKQFSVIVNGYLENKVKDDDIKFVKDNVFVNLANSGKFQDDMWHGVNPNEVKLNDVKLIKKGGAAFDTNKYELKPTKVEMAHAPSSDGGPGKSVITYTLRVKYFDTWTEAQNQKVEVKCRNNRKELEDLLKNSNIEPMIHSITRDGFANIAGHKMFAHSAGYIDSWKLKNMNIREDNWIPQYMYEEIDKKNPDFDYRLEPDSSKESDNFWANKYNIGFTYLDSHDINENEINNRYKTNNNGGFYKNIKSNFIKNITNPSITMYQNPNDYLNPANSSNSTKQYPEIYKLNSGSHDMTLDFRDIQGKASEKYKKITPISIKDFFNGYIDEQLYFLNTRKWESWKLKYKYIDSAIKQQPYVYLIDEDVVLEEKSWFNNHIIIEVENRSFLRSGNVTSIRGTQTIVFGQNESAPKYQPAKYYHRPEGERNINIPTIVFQDVNFPSKNRIKVKNNITYKNVVYNVEMISHPMVFKNTIKTDLEDWKYDDRKLEVNFFNPTNSYFKSLRWKQSRTIYAYQAEVWYDFNYEDDNRISVEFK
ncbi:hypothetical protein, partial [Mycoplasma elephantis]|uniref:hypothetical protein n=1 Tax=Mycoplasma elephantis TaxID=114882 RepID=UPI00055BB7B9